MKRSFLLVLTAAAMAAAAPGATAAPDRTATVEAGQAFTWEGTAEVSANLFYFEQVPGQPNMAPAEQGTCSDSPHQGCDEILVKLVNPLAQDDSRTSKVRSATIDLTGYAPPAQAADFDLQVFASNADGENLGFFTGDRETSQSGNWPGEAESVSVDVVTTRDKPEVYMLVRVIRFLSPNATYTGSVTF